MSNRLIEVYEVGEVVEMTFGQMKEVAWFPAVVVGHDPPGMWVKTGDGRRWFMTNGRRVRKFEKLGVWVDGENGNE